MAAATQSGSIVWGLTKQTQKNDRKMARKIGQEVKPLPMSDAGKLELIVRMIIQIFITRRRKVKKSYIRKLAEEALAGIQPPF